MTFSRVKVAWVNGDKVNATQMNKLDLDHSRAVDKTGDIIEDASIQFGEDADLIVGDGAGFRIEGGSDGYINDTSGLWLADGATLTAISGAQVTIRTGARVDVSGTLHINDAGGLIYDGAGSGLSPNDWPQFGSARTVYVRDFPRLIGQNTADLCSYSYESTETLPILVSANQTTVGKEFWLEIPRGPNYSHLENIYVWSKGVSGTGSGTIVRGSYRVLKKNMGTPGTNTLGLTTNVISAVTDAHASDGSNWTEWVETTVAVGETMTNNTYAYYLRCAAPYNSSDDCGIQIGQIVAEYTTSALRF